MTVVDGAVAMRVSFEDVGFLSAGGLPTKTINFRPELAILYVVEIKITRTARLVEPKIRPDREHLKNGLFCERVSILTEIILCVQRVKTGSNGSTPSGHVVQEITQPAMTVTRARLNLLDEHRELWSAILEPIKKANSLTPTVAITTISDGLIPVVRLVRKEHSTDLCFPWSNGF